MTKRQPNAEELFHAVASLPGEEQQAYLDARCPDPKLRAEVEKLLAYDRLRHGQSTDHFSAAGKDSPSELKKFEPKLRDNRLTDSASSSSNIDHGRFLPGTVLSERYRIVGLLGKGGMGEVYRADDLELGQSVALKFLPARVANDPRALERFRGEVRLARQVSHPNVCRVYDIGQIKGKWFLSMEYVDGEDLAQLLLRIGHFPADRATSLSRQLCLGMHAAHEKGVLHRDLKPANIMIDGRGKLLITDFGLAAVANDVRDEDIRSGTPAYMSPEQLAGREVTIRSDIYALGLILHEIYTGKQVWQPEERASLLVRGSDISPPPSSHVDLDPAVDAVIRRCLEPSPEKRPPSVINILACLPGGDPLQAALAAGETPSPEMVAEAGETTGLNIRVAVGCLVGVLLLLPLNYWLNDFVSNLRPSALNYEPAVLADEAREILAKDLGMNVEDGFAAYGIDKEWNGEPGIQDQMFYFWYRQRLRGPDFDVDNYWSVGRESYARVDYYRPSKEVPGEVDIILGGDKRLCKFRAWPALKLWTTREPAACPWSDWFKPERTGYFLPTTQGEHPPPSLSEDIVTLDVCEDRWRAVLVPFDKVQAWKGIDPITGETFYIQAAAFQGKPTFFGKFTAAEFEQPDLLESENGSSSISVLLAIVIFSLTTGTVLAWRNFRLGHGDHRGALRVSTYNFSLGFVTLMTFCHHHWRLGWEVKYVIFAGTAQVLLPSAFIFLWYMALEPYVRRVWPQVLISSSRLISGRFRDPLVGRDLLVGTLFGMILATLVRLLLIASPSGISSSPNWIVPASSTLAGMKELVGEGLRLHYSEALELTAYYLLTLIVFTMLFRSKKAAMVCFIVIYTGLFALPAGENPTTQLVVAALAVLLLLIVIVRWGALAILICMTTILWALAFPLTCDASRWYFSHGLFIGLLIMALAVCGFYLSTRGQTLFASSLEPTAQRLGR